MGKKILYVAVSLGCPGAPNATSTVIPVEDGYSVELGGHTTIFNRKGYLSVMPTEEFQQGGVAVGIPVGTCYEGPQGVTYLPFADPVSAYGYLHDKGILTVNKMRLIVLQQGLKLEAKHGMYITDPRRVGGTSYALVKREFGLKGSKEAVYKQFTMILARIGMLKPSSEGAYEDAWQDPKKLEK